MIQLSSETLKIQEGGETEGRRGILAYSLRGENLAF